MKIFSLLVPFVLLACENPDRCLPGSSARGGGMGGAAGPPVVEVGVGAATSGDYVVPPREPLGFEASRGGCERVPGTHCEESCLQDYEDRAATCGRIPEDSARRDCQDGAYTHYKNCFDACDKAATDCLERCREQCDKANQQCIDRCRRGDKNCMRECNEENGRCLKECSKRCK